MKRVPHSKTNSDLAGIAKVVKEAKRQQLRALDMLRELGSQGSRVSMFQGRWAHGNIAESELRNKALTFAVLISPCETWMAPKPVLFHECASVPLHCHNIPFCVGMPIVSICLQLYLSIGLHWSYFHCCL